MSLPLQKARDEIDEPPGRYRPARCRNSNVGFVEPVPPGEHKARCPNRRTFNTSSTPTNRGRKRWLPGSIPPRTVWGTKSGVREATGTRGIYDPIPGTKYFPKAVIPSGDTGSHGLEIPTAGPPLLAEVREAGGFHPLGARRSSKFNCHDLIGLYLIVK